MPAAPGIPLQPVNPLEFPDWDVALARRPDFSFFHSAAWTRVLVETYGYQPVWLGNDSAWLPLMVVDSWLTGRRAIALPFTDECPPLCESEVRFQELYQAAVALGRQRGWQNLELRGGRGLLPQAPAAVAFYAHSLDLTVGPTRLFDGFEGSARRAVRKAEKDGVTVEILRSEAALRDFYLLQCLTRRRHGLPPQPLKFFLNIWRHVIAHNQGFVALARWRGVAVAAAVFLFLGGRAIYKFGASDFRCQHLRPNNLAMWAGIQWLATHGAVTLSLGRTSLANEGLRRFKLNLGAVERRLEYVKFDLRRNSFRIETDHAAGWHNRIFRRLPLSLSRGVGAFLYQHCA